MRTVVARFGMRHGIMRPCSSRFPDSEWRGAQVLLFRCPPRLPEHARKGRQPRWTPSAQRVCASAPEGGVSLPPWAWHQGPRRPWSRRPCAQPERLLAGGPVAGAPRGSTKEKENVVFGGPRSRAPRDVIMTCPGAFPGAVGITCAVGAYWLSGGLRTCCAETKPDKQINKERKRAARASWP